MGIAWALAFASPLVAAQTAPPSTGAILKQSTTAAPPLSAPGTVIRLPEPAQQVLSPSVTLDVTRIVIEDNRLIATDQLKPLVAGLAGHTRRLSDLDGALTRITDYYRSHGYPLAYAYLPAQTIDDGVVRIRIVEPRYDQIRVKAEGRLAASQAARTLGVKSGDPVEQKALERGLLLLNRTPGVHVAGTLLPGAQSGTTTLEATVRDTSLLGASLALDNDGNDSIGRTRASLTASLNDPFGYGSQIAVNALHSAGNLLRAQGINLLSPDLGGGVRLSAYGSRTAYTLGGAFRALGETGVARQYGLAASVPLVLAPGRIVEARLDLLRNRFTQRNAVAATADDARLDLARLSVNGSWVDRHGVTSAGVGVTRGDKAIQTPAQRAADAAGPRTAGAFWVAQADVTRTQMLGHGFRAQLALSGQAASKNLDGSQQFYLGGPQGVMSYAVGTAGGNAGALARAALYRDIALGRSGTLTVGALGQTGSAWRSRGAYPGTPAPDRVNLSGAGFGVGYRYGAWLDFEMEYIRRLGHAAAGVPANGDGEFWASFTIHLGN